MSGAPERAIVLVLRAWSEAPGALRVRITAAPVWGQGDEEVTVTSSADAALEVVRRWLEAAAGR